MDTDSLRFKDQDSGEYEAAGVSPGFETWKAIMASSSTNGLMLAPYKIL